MTVDLIQQALNEHRAGRLPEAKKLYEQALAQDPQHADALHLLGVVALQGGDAGRAAALIEQAIEVQPENPGFHANLAQAYLALGRVADAQAAFGRAATLDPREPQFALGAANCLALQGRHAEAEQQLRSLVRQHPGFALAWYNLGKTLGDQGRHEEAADCLRRAVELDPAFADACMNLGGALHALERFEEAEQAYRQCLALAPDSMAGYCNLASVLIDRGRFAEAAAVCEQGIARSRDSVDLHLVLGTAFTFQGKLTPALSAFGTAARLAPDSARAAGAYGSTLRQTGHHEEGMEWLEYALKLQPESLDFRHAIAGARLSAGDLQAGWREYESRPARQRFLAGNPGLRPARELPEDLSGKKVCLLREQGLGDELFFLRFAPVLKLRGAEIIYRAHAKIASLLERVPALDRVISQEDPLPAADSVLLIGDLPQALGRLASSPYRPRPSSQQRRPGAAAARDVRFPRLLRAFFPEPPPPLALAPLPDQIERVRQRLATLGAPPYLGLTWRAGTPPDQQRGRIWVLHKEIPLDRLGAAVREVNGTVLALQRNPGPGEIEQLATHLGKPVHDLSALNEDLEAMLALLALIDDYIGVSNTNMHLRAGAGQTASVLVPLPAEWRWMISGDRSPWFPGFPVYRQGTDGNWGPALARLRQDLVAKFGAREQ